MQRCTRVGVNVTKRCNWKCRTCFYRHAPDFNTPYDRPLQVVMAEIEDARGQGCDHVVVVGWGEPTFWPPLLDMIREAAKLGMTSSIITNGSVAVAKYAAMRDAGLNHLHVSVHGLSDTIDRISGVGGSEERQYDLMNWLKKEDWPWRMNMTVQRENYRELREIAMTCLHFGCRHIISLGFLPHYEWSQPGKMQEVAVHPAELRPFIEEVIRTVESHNEYAHHGTRAILTVRYHPFCHLSPEYWKYIVNARYVGYDPWEWKYQDLNVPDEIYKKNADALGDSVAVDGPPCNGCSMKIHCGGWNRYYAAGFDGAGLCAVGPEPYPGARESDMKLPGFFHNQNPANHRKGYF